MKTREKKEPTSVLSPNMAGIMRERLTASGVSSSTSVWRVMQKSWM